jgi:hypothetical protein
MIPPKPELVLRHVAEAYGITVANVKKRSAPVSPARLVAYRMIHDDCRLPWVRVAEIMGLLPSSSGDVAKKARRADPEAVEEIRHVLYNGNQRSLF